MAKTNLKTFPLNSLEEGQEYDEHLASFPDNPFYKKELLIPNLPKDGELFYFILEEEGTPMALMPFFKRKIFRNRELTPYFDISSPYGYSGPLFCREASEKTKASFWAQVDNWHKKNNIITEFMRFSLQKNWEGYNGELVATLKNVCGKIRPELEQWENFKPKVRNNFRRAVKSGLTSKVYFEEIDKEIISQFCAIYHGTMERRNAGEQYFQTQEYFSDLINKNPKSIAIAMIYKGDIPVSTELLLLSEEVLFSYLGGTNAAYFSLRPNDMLKIEVLNWGRKNGYKHYCLGGGRMEGDSLYKYKKNFFPKDEDLVFHTGRKILNQQIYKELFEINPFCVDCPVTFFFPKYRCNELC
ncbi:MAG: GNAT family N-acetyltransferase [Flavobacteriaceae bacterium]